MVNDKFVCSCIYLDLSYIIQRCIVEIFILGFQLSVVGVCIGVSKYKINCLQQVWLKGSIKIEKLKGKCRIMWNVKQVMKRNFQNKKKGGYYLWKNGNKKSVGRQ